MHINGGPRFVKNLHANSSGFFIVKLLFCVARFRIESGEIIVVLVVHWVFLGRSCDVVCRVFEALLALAECNNSINLVIYWSATIKYSLVTKRTRWQCDKKYGSSHNHTR